MARNNNKNCKPVRRNNQNRGNSTRQERRETEVIDTSEREYKSSRNDFSWWNHFTEYTNYAGTLPFGLPLGNTVDMWNSDSGFTNRPVPGVMAIRFIPGIGYSADKNSPINKAAIKWYSSMRMQQKASGDYDSQDQMIGLVGLDSMFMFHAWLKRIIGIANVSDPLNRYKPEVLLMANAVDPDDVRNNIDDYWGYCNKFAADLAHFAMPKNFDLRIRHEWMCSGVYQDADNTRSQLYMFVPYGFWKYDNTVTTGSQLTMIPISYSGFGSPVNLMTLADIKAIGNQLINGMLGDEDIGTIMGDLMNYLGTGAMIGLEETPRDYRVMSSYNVEVLSQIENLYCFPNTVTNNVITQDPSVNNGAILYQPAFENAALAPNALFNRRFILNIHKGTQPSVEDVMEATRLTAIFTGPYPATGPWTPKAYGTEICTHLSIWEMLPNGNYKGIQTPYPFSNVISIDPTNATSVENSLRVITQLSAFDWHPQVLVATQSGTGSAMTFNPHGLLLDYDQFTTVDDEKLMSMHDAALMSVLYIGDK